MKRVRRERGREGEGRHFIAQQCGRQKKGRGREIIACLRAAISSCAMNTKDCTALQLALSLSLSPSLRAPPLKTQRNCSCPNYTPITHFTLRRKKPTRQQLSTPSTRNYSPQEPARTHSRDQRTSLERVLSRFQ